MTQFQFPIKSIRSPYTPDTMANLKAICKTSETALGGDIAALRLTIVVNEDEIASHVSTVYIVHTGDHQKPYMSKKYNEMPQHQMLGIAPHIMPLIHDNHMVAGLTDAGGIFSNLYESHNSTDYFDVFMTPNFLLVSVDDYVDTISDGKFSGLDIDQNEIDETFKAVIIPEVTTAHEITAIGHIASDLKGLGAYMLHDDNAYLSQFGDEVMPPDLANLIG